VTIPTGEETAAAAKAPRAWYFFTDDIPDGELLVPIVGDHGIAFAVRTKAIPQEALDALNQAADLLLGLGLASIQLPHQAPPPEP
jgi:hypothetical protein